ncbi:hypothetical protein E2C01_023504 [Portunus trituberculatus]|uniref:Uncharacterized protein n=1 Tax=Portunus trituberculatus TaxID=210409 RepID=A0A5B7EBQ6_PORTR|nr:hypothetical protein [Portunus trituberculatus]
MRFCDSRAGNTQLLTQNPLCGTSALVSEHLMIITAIVITETLQQFTVPLWREHKQQAGKHPCLPHTTHHARRHMTPLAIS